MSRTFRRRTERHEYRCALREYEWVGGHLVPFQLDQHSAEGRRAIARFHSDAYETMRSTAPRWYRRIFDHRLSTLNARELRRCLDDTGSVRLPMAPTFFKGLFKLGDRRRAPLPFHATEILKLPAHGRQRAALDLEADGEILDLEQAHRTPVSGTSCGDRRRRAPLRR